jgi:hypothetical protein
MKLYAVFKEGVLRHECGGIFSTFKAALDAATNLINGERDSYHTYEVVPFFLNKQTEQTSIGVFGGGELIEEWAIARLVRDNHNKVVIDLREDE